MLVFCIYLQIRGNKKDGEGLQFSSGELKEPRTYLLRVCCSFFKKSQQIKDIIYFMKTRQAQDPRVMNFNPIIAQKMRLKRRI
jgi:hypothetical protein